jgi:glycosyltransferase involved in cell wall biosynthesis
VGGIPLAVRSGVDGLLVEPAQPDVLARALVDVLSDEPRRCAMGAQARQRVQETFAASVILPQVESLWAELLGVPQLEALR